MKRKRRKEMNAIELRKVLKDRVLYLDCGHRFCLHPFSNTLVITAKGDFYCHNCYF